MREKIKIADRLAQYWPNVANTGTHSEGAESMSAKVVEDPASRTASLIRQLIAARWQGTDKELYEAAGVSSASLGNLKKHGAESVTPSLKKICRVLRLDPYKLIQGKVVDAIEKPVAHRSYLHDLVDRITGTSDEATAERVLRALIEARR